MGAGAEKAKPGEQAARNEARSDCWPISRGPRGGAQAEIAAIRAARWEYQN
jgi:hypothetical protein